MSLPKITKKINAFLLGEDGKISKESILKVGVVATAAVAVTLSSSSVAHGSGHDQHISNAGGICADRADTHNQHCNNLSVRFQRALNKGQGVHGHGTHSSKHGSY